MVKRLFLVGSALLLATELVVASAYAAPPVCGRNACREEIDACQAAQCESLSGRARAQCRRECVTAVTSACDADPTVCNPATTSTTTTTSSTTTTTQYGSPSRAFMIRGDLLD
jgi:hypothetical protein